jgi:YhcH/YjgK/YiaL family protein
MIFDRLEHADRYRSLSPGIAVAFDYLRSTDFAQTTPGRHELDGSRVIAMVSRYQTKRPEEAVWESHRRYIDVQYIASGVERLGYAHLSTNPAIREAYSEERDVLFYEPQQDSLEAQAGTFLIFFPHDVHAPGLMRDAPAEVLKVVVKVAVDA